MHFAKPLVAALVAIGFAATPVLAEDPTGSWQSATGESRYQVTFCGDGTQLCAKLTWLREDARTAENLPYLNRYVVQGAVPAGENVWEGKVAYAGDVYSGSMVMRGDTLRLKGCKGMFCKSMSFVRR